MSRWEPNARERLEQSALELFLDQGYAATTVAQIAERAGLAKSAFFRYFADKPEVVFGRDELRSLLVEAIAEAPGSATPIGAVGVALAAAAKGFRPERRVAVQQRQAVIAGNSDLRERELLKRAGLAAAMADALRGRGVPDPTASLAAELGSLALRESVARWAEPDSEDDFGSVAEEQLSGLMAAAAGLDRGTRA